MLAYQHAYHAGNFADVHKHLALYALTEALMKKSSAVTLVDTHAGRGSYPLDAPETRRLGEYRNGVLPLWQQSPSGDALLDGWCRQLAAHQPATALSVYPGSPWWLARTLRDRDQLTLFELHPGEQRHLDAAALPGEARIRHRHADGLAGLEAMLPVKTPRLAVLIDPSWELRDEYATVAATLERVMRKVRHAIVLVWYPLLPQGRHHTLLDGMKRHGLRKVWRSELSRFEATDQPGLYGSGLALINPPWQLPERLDESFRQLAALYGPPATHRSMWWLGE
ncbi:23S rRNA (adenine2030-N6)-methyltransferase [Kushneria sinocarnis]|uniref:Ribosomal RNA large subunit methyltransferase J n=1 Tax=Kushneria sinocarnis TaxID=595502 RepID=A0A420X0J1_9GAMM|nr:23S rRNA (adenine(2030)-N(6))-methyltransferase RlmJ [Kushneria sinocarnis]RKR07270.1 23S rRNA (adenine2030-N6)-methyltransferase [Kushneria sinocarnis]